MANIIENTSDAHPIERIMSTAMTKIKTLVDTDTIVGSPMATMDGSIVIPVSKVSMGFLTGGGEYDSAQNNKHIDAFPFAGGSGAGVSVTPIGFLVGKDSHYSMVTVSGDTPYGKLLELVPELISSLSASDASHKGS